MEIVMSSSLFVSPFVSITYIGSAISGQLSAFTRILPEMSCGMSPALTTVPSATGEPFTESVRAVTVMPAGSVISASAPIVMSGWSNVCAAALSSVNLPSTSSLRSAASASAQEVSRLNFPFCATVIPGTSLKDAAPVARIVPFETVRFPHIVCVRFVITSVNVGVTASSTTETPPTNEWCDVVVSRLAPVVPLMVRVQGSSEPMLKCLLVSFGAAGGR